MEEASCQKAAYVSSYQENIQDFTVIQGPAARIRPVRLPEDFFSCKITRSFPVPFSIHFLPWAHPCPSLEFSVWHFCFVFVSLLQLTMRGWWRTYRYARHFSPVLRLTCSIQTLNETITHLADQMSYKAPPPNNPSHTLSSTQLSISLPVCLSFSVRSQTSPWGPSWRSTYQNGCTLPTMCGLKGPISTWSLPGRQHCKTPSHNPTADRYWHSNGHRWNGKPVYLENVIKLEFCLLSMMCLLFYNNLTIINYYSTNDFGPVHKNT